MKFLRNPYFDDHFDLADPNHIVGKTLAWASPLVGGVVGRNCEVLGWALYNKWEELEAALERLRAGKEHIAASVVSCWQICCFGFYYILYEFFNRKGIIFLIRENTLTK